MFFTLDVNGDTTSVSSSKCAEAGSVRDVDSAAKQTGLCILYEDFLIVKRAAMLKYAR